METDRRPALFPETRKILEQGSQQTGLAARVKAELELACLQYRLTARVEYQDPPGASNHILTATAANAALRAVAVRIETGRASMGDIVERILRSHEGGVSGNIRGKMRNYINLLASTGKTDEQLLQLGKAYLKEIQNPDPRYSGC